MKKIRRTWITGVLYCILAISLSACGINSDNSDKSNASAQAKSNYPIKPILVVAPSGAGGGWDRTARTFVKGMADTKLVVQPMLVENKPGGGGAVFMAEYATKDTKNDYKLFTSSPPILINHLKRDGNSPFGYKDSTPLAQLTKDFGSIVVKSDSKYQDLSSLLDALRVNPSKITIAGGSAPGSMYHLVGILPAYKSGIDHKSIKYVSYDGTSEAMTALLGENADVIATDASSVTQFVKAGQVRVLAVASPERLGGELKDVPTMKELGIDAEFAIWRGIFGPKEMSPEALTFWNDKINKLTGSAEWKEVLESNGWEGDYKNSVDFSAFLQDQEQMIKELLVALDMAK
ncbi:Bug family tripartite tricarboxylate transporter substrate binding protein [Brevibacillus daliensis]|uniref:Bug family tripartite tricarboxylate transporter substrate binding protein n=1 Tax=Brevibacillus daliensis TaxID=2892995 RepID=UPI001E4E6455|nr:tripartite tricarboxylate transporter substrate binding protein [Brevibacillus daliensis]